VDGDTVWITACKKVDAGFRVKITVEHELEFRVYGIDTPEDNAGKPAAARAKELAPAGSDVTMVTYKPLDEDKYGRWLATIVTPEGVDVAAELLRTSYGVPYFGGKKQ
jgi:endonuclease YncB( thermonuclease family)